MEQNTDESSQSSITQKELFSKALLDIKEDVTRDDRTICLEKLQLSKITIDRYINGSVHDIDTAQKILACLKKRIERRAKSLKK